MSLPATSNANQWGIHKEKVLLGVGQELDKLALHYLSCYTPALMVHLWSVHTIIRPSSLIIHATKQHTHSDALVLRPASTNEQASLKPR